MTKLASSAVLAVTLPESMLAALDAHCAERIDSPNRSTVMRELLLAHLAQVAEARRLRESLDRKDKLQAARVESLDRNKRQAARRLERQAERESERIARIPPTF